MSITHKALYKSAGCILAQQHR